MKFNNSVLFATITLSILAMAQAQAGNKKTSDERIDRQAQRIGKGITNDQLSNIELQRIQKRQNKILDMKASGASEAEIQAAQNKASKQIHRLKHNDTSEFNQKVRGNRIDNRLDNLQERLGKGVIDGSLTQQEANKIGDAIARVKELRAKKEADGKLSAVDAKELKDREDALSKMIHNKRHNKKGSQPASIPAN